MKITDVKTFVVNCFRTNFVFVKLYADDGLTGVGEGTLEYKEHALVGAIEDLKVYLIGKNPLDREPIVQSIYRESYWRTGPVLMAALSAVDMALWDMAGKHYGASVSRLLGGRTREAIKMYANGWFAGAKEPDEFAEAAARAAAKGVRALKWDPFGKAYMHMDASELSGAIRCVRAVREAVGEGVELLIEGHGRFNQETAVRAADALAEFKPMWFEEPVPPDSMAALAHVRGRSPVPIAAGERVYGLSEYEAFFEARCADFAQPDPSHAGGITGVKKIAAMAEARHIPVAPHNPSGPVANAAALQLAGNLDNFLILEIMLTDVDWRSELTNEEVAFSDGRIAIPDKPGLGLELNETACAKHPFEPTYLRHYKGTLTDIRPKGRTKFYFSGI